MAEARHQTLTPFTGVPFDEDHPYSPREAKRFLAHVMEEVRQRDRLREFGADGSLPGRDRVKERDLGVWDVVRLRGSNGEKAFNELPHFTLAFRPAEILAVLILPNEWLKKGPNRKTIEVLRFGGFESAVARVTNRLVAVLGQSMSARPWILLQQRRATKGQQLDVWDALLEFDPRTAVGAQEEAGGQRRIKLQPQWLLATYEALRNRNSNLEMCIGARLLYGTDVVRSRGLIDEVLESWSACTPLIDAVLNPEAP